MLIPDLVSIIMPMHNSAAYVAEAIASVVAQSYERWELLVVDDGSTDNSATIVEEWTRRDPRILLLHNTHNIGLPAVPRNMGVIHARGRYIAFLDSDDCWLPNKLADQIPLFNNKRIAIAYSNYTKMDKDGQAIGGTVIARPQTNYQQMLRGNDIGNLTGMYDRQKVGLVPILPIHHEDYAMWLQILKKGFLAVNTNTVTARYRVHASSVSANKLRVLAWQWRIYRQQEGISATRSAFYYLHYALNAFRKTL